MMFRRLYTRSIVSFLLLLTNWEADCQKDWEGIVYWNFTNITLFNYELLNTENQVYRASEIAHSQSSSTRAWFAGDSIVAFIYPNREKSSFGGRQTFNRKFNKPGFLDTSFLSNTFPFLSQQLITIRINGQFITKDAPLNQLLAKETTVTKNLQSVKIKGQGILLFHYKLKDSDSIIITTHDQYSGVLLDEYKFFKIDPLPHIIAAYDLSEKEQFAQLMLKRDSLQLNAGVEKDFANPIKVSPIHNDLLLLLKRFNEADTLRIEYRLLKAGDKKSTEWSITENEIPIIQFNNLARGQKYVLQLRYNLTPFIVKEHAVHVGIYWWQIIYIQVLIAFIVGVLLTGIAWSIYRRKKEKQLLSKEEKRKQLELQLSSVRAQLNPHFIFNALGTLQTLINRVEIEKANIYLGRVSKLMRSTLENSAKLLAGLDEEIEYLSNYLEIESLRFDFKYDIEVENGFPVHDVDIPAMFIQPIVENAIKHGLSGIKNGCLVISIKKELHTMIISVKDNGPGFKDTARQGRFGLHLTYERIRLLNQVLHPKQIKFDIECLPGATNCIFTFQNWL